MPSKSPAPHVLAAIASAAQPKLSDPGRPVSAAHVQAMMRRAGGAVTPVAGTAAMQTRSATSQPGTPRRAPHVERVIAAAAQPKPAGSAPAVQPSMKKVVKTLFDVTRTTSGFSSTKLRGFMEKDFGFKIPKHAKVEAHHIIPKELVKMKILRDIKFDFDQAINGVLLARTRKSTLIGMGTLHRGSHPIYTEVIQNLIEDYVGRGYDPEEVVHAVILCASSALKGERGSLRMGDSKEEIRDFIESDMKRYQFSDVDIDKL